MSRPHERITSTRNPRYKEALFLRDSRERRRRDRILIDGLREIERALDAGVRPLEVYIGERLFEDGGGPVELAERVIATGAEVVEVTDRLLGRLAYGDRDVGIVVVADTPPATLDLLELPADPLLAVVEGVEKPGNLGAIMRTADGAGFSALIVADPATDLFNPNVIRASLGIVFSMPVAVAPTSEVLPWLVDRHIEIVAAQVDATTDYTEADLTGPLAIALGSEAQGLSEAWADVARTSVSVPMLGTADSLNVSATAAILFYEAVRQRRVAAG